VRVCACARVRVRAYARTRVHAVYVHDLQPRTTGQLSTYNTAQWLALNKN